MQLDDACYPRDRERVKGEQMRIEDGQRTRVNGTDGYVEILA